MTEFFPTLRELTNLASANAELSVADRRLAGARALDISGDFLLWADAVVGEHETYRVETGSNVVVSTPVTLEAVRGYVRYLLQPRRPTTMRDPDWLLCYGCDLAEWPTFAEVWSDGVGIAIGRLDS